MPDLDHLRIDGTTYDLKDSTAREKDAVQDTELSQLKSAFKNITGNEPILYSDPSKRQYIVTNGTNVQWDTPSTSQTQIKWAVVPCVPGDVFTINGRGGNSDRLWAFADASKNILDPRAGSGASATNLVLTAPANAAYLILNSEIPMAESYTGELLLERLDGFVENDNLLYDFALQGNGSTIVSENFKLLAGNTYKLAVLNSGSWSGSSSSIRIQVNTHPSGGDHIVVVTYTPNDEYTFTADADDATIMVRADAGSTVQIKLYDITEITNYISGLERAAFANDFAVESGTTYCTVSWSRLYVQTNGQYYDFDTSASYTLNASNPILAIRNFAVTLFGSFRVIRSTDIILLVYNNGAIVGGLLYPYYANAGTGTGSGIGILPNAVFCNNFTAESIVRGVKIGWTRLYIKLKDGEFNTTTTANYELNNNSPILIVRNNNILQIGSFSQLRETDVVLLVCYYGTVTGGLLYPYYKNSIEQFRYADDAHLNVYRNTQQLANLKWTPKSAVDSGEGEHPAGVEVTGVPYSSVKEYLKYVGIDVSIHTFMTAVNDAHSLLYTEYPMGDGSQSAYGRTYHGVNCKAYFGSVCSGFVTTGLGSTIQYNSWEFQTFPDVFDVLVNQDVKNLMVGDIMSYDGHCCVVTNIRRTSAGNIATLQLEEHSAPIHIGAGHTPNTLTARAIASKGVWCRYKNLENNTKYTPSAFVLAPNEYLYNGGDFCYIDGVSNRTYYQCKPSNPNSDATFTASKWNAISTYTPGTAYTSVPASYMSINEKLYQCIDGHTAGSTPDMTKWKELHGVFEWAAYPYVYNDDIVTFAGDRAAYHSNDLIYINYTKGSYTAMQIYKDGTLTQTITLPASGYQVDVSSYCASAGMYKARLTDGTNYSRYTYFEVIDTDVSATWANGEATIEFSSANGTPIEWQIVEQSGATVCHNSFSAEEITNGQVIVNPKAKMYAEKYIYPRRVNGYSATIYARVMFAGEYGNVVNAMIELGTLSDVSGELVFPNEPKDIGKISETKNILLAGRMHGNQYSFTFEGGGAAVNVLPAIGTIKWAEPIPSAPLTDTTYLVTIDNGIGNVVSVS